MTILIFSLGNVDANFTPLFSNGILSNQNNYKLETLPIALFIRFISQNGLLDFSVAYWITSRPGTQGPRVRFPVEAPGFWITFPLRKHFYNHPRFRLFVKYTFGVDIKKSLYIRFCFHYNILEV